MPVKEKVLTPELIQQEVQRAFFPVGKAPQQRIGLELEIWPFRTEADNPVGLIPFFDESGQGLIDIIRQLEGPAFGLTYLPTADGTPKFTFEDGATLTFEPGGQLEYSSAPHQNASQAIQAIQHVIETLRCHFKKENIWFFHGGLNPWHTVAEVGLQLQKPRYINMDRFFEKIGPFGQKMMRLSTSLQVNLDVGDPETAQRRWLAANLLGPVFTALFANSPFADRKPTGAYSYRSLLWQRLDPSRTGFQKGFLAPEYHPCPVGQYLDFALNAYCMRLPDHQGDLVFEGHFKSFKTWLEDGHQDTYPDLDDWRTHLTTLFPEVRAKGFFEIRYLDAQSKVWCAIPGILLHNLIYDAEACEKVIQWLSPYRTTLPQMQAAAAHHALTDREIASLAKKIFHLAMDSAPAGEEPNILALCERFYERYTGRERTPACELIELNGGSLFTPVQYRDFEKSQVDMAGDIIHMICEYM